MCFLRKEHNDTIVSDVESYSQSHCLHFNPFNTILLPMTECALTLFDYASKSETTKESNSIRMWITLLGILKQKKSSVTFQTDNLNDCRLRSNTISD